MTLGEELTTSNWSKEDYTANFRVRVYVCLSCLRVCVFACTLEESGYCNNTEKF